MTVINIEHITKIYGKKIVLDDVSLTIDEGDRVALMGPNGAGKTTLIRCVLGLVHPTKGAIRFGGFKDDFRKYIGYVPQNIRFPENLTLEDLIHIAEDMRGERGGRKDELFQLLNLDGEMRKRVRDMSGGSQQKVSLLLALMFDPLVLILDEPFISLDAISAYKVKNFLTKESKTMICISHISSDLENLTEKIAFLIDGKLIFWGYINELKSKTKSPSLEEAILCLLKY